MDVLLPLLFTFLVILVTGQLIKSARNRRANQPPSPWKLPIIGNMHQLLGAAPYRSFRKLSQRYGPIMHLKLGQVDHIIISGPEAAREILKTQDINFASRPQLFAPTIVIYGNRDIVFSPYGSHWRQLRKICMLQLLSNRRVKSFRHIRESEISSLIESILIMSAPALVNLTEMLLLLTNRTTARAAFGAECKHGPRFISETRKGLDLASGFNLADLFPSLSFLNTLLGIKQKIQSIHKKMDEILEEIIAEHLDAAKKKSTTTEEEEDLVDVLLRVKNSGDLDFPLTMVDIKAVTLDMFIGGTDTSVMTLTWAMSELIRHPIVMQKVQGEVRRAATGKNTIDECDMEELQYMKLVIKEILRLHPPLPLLVPRVCGETCNVRGFEIPAGSRVLVNAWAMSRDPKYWGEDAENFRPERFERSSMEFIGETFEYIPFGGGRRVCPGLAFGLANLEINLAKLLYHFNWDLPAGMEPEDLDMTESFGATVSRKTNLCLVATPWSPPSV